MLLMLVNVLDEVIFIKTSFKYKIITKNIFSLRCSNL